MASAKSRRRGLLIFVFFNCFKCCQVVEARLAVSFRGMLVHHATDFVAGNQPRAAAGLVGVDLLIED